MAAWEAPCVSPNGILVDLPFAEIPPGGRKVRSGRETSEKQKSSRMFQLQINEAQKQLPARLTEMGRQRGAKQVDLIR